MTMSSIFKKIFGQVSEKPGFTTTYTNVWSIKMKNDNATITTSTSTYDVRAVKLIIYDADLQAVSSRMIFNNLIIGFSRPVKVVYDEITKTLTVFGT